LTPVLPAVALIFGAALLKLPWRRLRWGLLALILVFGAVQFFVLSYESVNHLLPPRQLDLPGWGRSSTFAQGVYIQLPDEGVTDSGYWIEPDVLERMEDYRQAQGQELVSAALLVNTSQINAGPFNYLILTQYPHLRVESLIRRFDDTSPYRRLFGHEYVLLKRQNSSANPAQQLVIEAILDGPPQLFQRLFELEASYSLPDGGTVYLYRQRYRLPANYPIEYVSRLAEDLSGRTRQGDAILLTPPQIAAPFVAHYDGPAELYAAPFGPQEMAEIATPQRRIFLVVGDAQAGPVPGSAQAWLDEHAFRAVHEWSDSLQLLIYGVEDQPATSPTAPATLCRCRSFGSGGRQSMRTIRSLCTFWTTKGGWSLRPTLRRRTARDPRASGPPMSWCWIATACCCLTRCLQRTTNCESACIIRRRVSGWPCRTQPARRWAIACRWAPCEPGGHRPV